MDHPVWPSASMSVAQRLDAAAAERGEGLAAAQQQAAQLQAQLQAREAEGAQLQQRAVQLEGRARELEQRLQDQAGQAAGQAAQQQQAAELESQVADLEQQLMDQEALAADGAARLQAQVQAAQAQAAQLAGQEDAARQDLLSQISHLEASCNALKARLPPPGCTAARAAPGQTTTARLCTERHLTWPCSLPASSHPCHKEPRLRAGSGWQA